MTQNGFNAVERALRHQTFGTLSTLSEQGRPHATGVVYAVSPKGKPLILYVTTRTTTRKVRNVRAHPDVAFVVPVFGCFAVALSQPALDLMATLRG
ncbi:pyridoxamine 5'-phosphate oxidase family protein [Mycobacterium sp.]|uniref:pyridoxamine 5'-phosphate oxidase family protein n=1 Tax=Mycobacterium sp. TaxID=1785 RepID=UPI003F966F51